MEYLVLMMTRFLFFFHSYLLFHFLPPSFFFRYSRSCSTLSDISFSKNQVTFFFSTTELWKIWCNMIFVSKLNTREIEYTSKNYFYSFISPTKFSVNLTRITAFRNQIRSIRFKLSYTANSKATKKHKSFIFENRSSFFCYCGGKQLQLIYS